MADRLRGVTATSQDESPEDQYVRQVGTKLDRLAGGRGCLTELRSEEQNAAQSPESIGILRIDFQCLLDIGLGLVQRTLGILPAKTVPSIRILEETEHRVEHS